MVNLVPTVNNCLENKHHLGSLNDCFMYIIMPFIAHLPLQSPDIMIIQLYNETFEAVNKLIRIQIEATKKPTTERQNKKNQPI